MRTWQKEALVVGIGLAVGTLIAVVNCATTRQMAAEAIGGVAVLFTFFHCQVATRLQEAEERRTIDIILDDIRARPPYVECHFWLRRYWVTKELLWLAAFVLWQAWTALLGVGLFLVYPLWRSYHARHRKERSVLTVVKDER